MAYIQCVELLIKNYNALVPL